LFSPASYPRRGRRTPRVGTEANIECYEFPARWGQHRALSGKGDCPKAARIGRMRGAFTTTRPGTR
jgi:hypothetical protein